MAAVSSRYARAFADVVFNNKMDTVKTVASVEQVAALLASSADMRNVWASPSIPLRRKIQLLDSIAASLELARQTRNFVAVLIEQRRIGLLPEIAALFQAELNGRMGFAEAEVTSARPLDEEERRQLESRMAKVTGRKIRARYAQDPSVLGGAVIKVGSTIYDGSVRGQLKKIKQQIAAR